MDKKYYLVILYLFSIFMIGYFFCFASNAIYNNTENIEFVHNIADLCEQQGILYDKIIETNEEACLIRIEYFKLLEEQP